MKTEILAVVHKPVLVTTCFCCPFVRSRKDYCSANTYLGKEGQNLWVSEYFVDETRHPDCPLLVDSIVVCAGSDKAIEAQS